MRNGGTRRAARGRHRAWRVGLCVGLGAVAGSTHLLSASRDLVLITIDTLRADYLSCNGASQVETPHLDRLAREGVNFARVRSPVPLTLPAHASIFTGHDPPVHGVRSNGGYRLRASELSLAEVLQDRGFRSLAVVGSFVLDRRFGLDQGFEVYEDRIWSTLDQLESLASERSAEAVFESFQSRLRDLRPGERLFAWVHFYDPHAPYAPPEPWASRYAGNPYAGEVAYTDAMVGRVLDELAARGRLDRTLVAVVGDHGEGLGEHGEHTHSLLIYNSTLHVPMLLRAPGLIPAGRRVEGLVRTIDLAPTLLDYLGFGAELGAGRSLRPLIDGSAEAASTSAYSESLYPEIVLGWSRLQGLETERHRLILAPQPELYDVVSDPGETRNLVAAEPDLFQRLRRQLAALTESYGDGSAGGDTGVDPEVVERLRSLGYVAGSTGGGATRSGSPVDPKENLELWHRIERGIGEFDRRDYRAAASIFAGVIEADPGVVLAWEYLGAARRELGDRAGAVAVYREALASGHESAELHLQLGRLLAEEGEARSARRELEIAVALDGRSVAARYHLGELLRAAGQHPPAIEQYRTALAINPSYVWAWNGLGRSLAALGRDLEALAALRQAVDVAPELPEGVFNLAVQLERMGRRREAVAAYQRFLELAGGPELEPYRRQARAAVERLEAAVAAEPPG